jgi:uncharacterized membrane protein
LILSKRHIAKTLSWRLIGTLDTLLLSWLITGDLFTGVKISVLETISKMILYYLHERVWFKSSVANSKKRHILKTFSWRLVGTLDTILIGWLISGNPFVGIKIGIAEVITKMVLYYLHEKVWYKSNFGLKSRN